MATKKKVKAEQPLGGKQNQCPQGYTWNGTKCVKDVG